MSEISPQPTTPLVDEETLKLRAHMKRRRWVMLSITAPILLIALAFAVKFLSMTICTAWSNTAYDRGNYLAAEQRLSPLTTFNKFEPYKVYFNTGTAQLQEGKFASAEHSLLTAIPLAPESAVCDVRFNLSKVYSMQADLAGDKGDHSAAVALYEKANETLNVPECAQDQQSQQEQDQNDQKRERDQSEGGQSPEQSQPPDSENSPSPSDPNQGDPNQGGDDPGQSQNPGGGEDPGQEGGGGSSPGQDTPNGQGGGGSGQGEGQGGSKKDELQGRNDDAQEQRDQDRQKSQSGEGNRKSW